MTATSTMPTVASDSGVLLSSMLTEAELLELVRAEGSPLDLVRSAALTIINRAIARRTESQEAGTAVVALLESPQARAWSLADDLLLPAFELCFPRSPTSTPVDQLAAERFIERAAISFPVLAQLAARERQSWDVFRMECLVEAMARRAKYIGQYGIARKEDPELSSMLTLLEETMLDKQTWVDFTAGRYRLATWTGKVLSLLYPIVSLPLINLAVDVRHKRDERPLQLHQGAAAYLLMAEVYSEELANKVLARESQETIGYLARNSNLSTAMAWRIYARCTKKGRGFSAGGMLAHREDVRQIVAITQAGTAAAGIVAQLIGSADGPAQVSVELARVALSGCADIGNRPVKTLVPILYERLGDDAGVELLRSCYSMEVVLEVLHQWRKAPCAGATLSALLADKRKTVRLRLIGQKERGPGRGSRAVHYPVATFSSVENRAAFYCEHVLPPLLGDSEPQIRELARVLIRDLAGSKQAEEAILFETPVRDLATYVRKCRLVDDLSLGVLVDHYKTLPRGREKQLAQAALIDTASRSSFSISRYLGLLELEDEGITSAIASTIGAMSLNTCEEVVHRLGEKWPVIYSREFFLRHRNWRVRAAFARTSHRLSAEHVAQLIEDSEVRVREAIRQNSCWEHYAATYAPTVGSCLKGSESASLVV